MSRLTRRAENGTAVYATPSGEPVKWENNRRKVLQKLADYEDLEEQGLLLKLPYNIANCGKIYFVDENDLEIYELLADKIEIYKMMISEKFVYTIDSFEFFYEDFGKIVFLTKEEAEQELKRLESAE